MLFVELLSFVFVEQLVQSVFVAGRLRGDSSVVQFQTALFGGPFLGGAKLELAAVFLNFFSMLDAQSSAWDGLNPVVLNLLLANNTQSHRHLRASERVKKAGKDGEHPPDYIPSIDS